jgi:site-specific recombinase XerD
MYWEAKKTEKEVKIIDYVDEYFIKVILANKQLSAGTVRNYKKSLNHFKAYLKVAGKESIVLSCMDNILCIEFKQYCRTVVLMVEMWHD